MGETYRIAVFSRPQTDGRTGADQSEQVAAIPTNPPVNQGDRRAVEIEDLGEQGDGIARIDRGYIVFVPNTDVGDQVTVEITRAHENFGFGEVVDEQPSPG